MIILFGLVQIITSINLTDISFSIWTGKYVWDLRVLQLARTWFTLVPKINLYTEGIPPHGINDFFSTSNHLDATLHVTPTLAEFMKFTAKNEPYNFVQNRHLFTIYYAWMNDKAQNTTHKWYFFGDDDTYLFPNVLLEILDEKIGEYSSEKMTMIGRGYKSLPFLRKFFLDSNKKSTLFLQGGAGILISRKLMEILGPMIVNCSFELQVPNFQMDIRIAFCLHNYFFRQDPKNANRIVKGIIKSDDAHFAGDAISCREEKHENNRIPYATFHKINDEFFFRLFNASTTIWKDLSPQRIEWMIDWSWIAGTKVKMPFLSSSEFTIDADFGLNFRFFDWQKYNHYDEKLKKLFQNEEVNATSQFVPIFNENDPLHRKPKMFQQTYSNGFILTLKCAPENMSLERSEFVLDSFHLSPNVGAQYFVNCPIPQTFFNNHRGKKSPQKVIYYSYDY